MRFLTVAFLLLILTLSVAHPANKTISGLETGKFTFQHTTQKQNHLFMWQFPHAFHEQPQIAYAIDGFKIHSGSFSNQFQLTTEVITSTGVIVKWKREVQRWISVSINYLASNRKDLKLGFSQIGLGLETELTHKIIFDKPIENQQSCVARMFLIGCSADGKLFDCKIVGKQFTPNTLSVTASVGGENTRQANISLSYIIFSPLKASFSSHGGMFDKHNFRGVFNTNVRKVIYKTDYIIFGFSIMKFDPENGQQIRTSIDHDEVMTVEAERQISFRFIYIALGKSSKESCKNPIARYEWNNQCLAGCPENTVPFQYANGGIACLTCSPKLHMRVGKTECECIEGYHMENKVCVEKVNENRQNSLHSNSNQQSHEYRHEHTHTHTHTHSHSQHDQLKSNQNKEKSLKDLFNKMQSQQESKVSSEKNEKKNQNHQINAVATSSQTIKNQNDESKINSVPVKSSSDHPKKDTSHHSPSAQPIYQTPVASVSNINSQKPVQAVSQKTNSNYQQMSTPVYSNNQVNSSPKTSVGANNCGQNAYMMSGLCFCKPGFKKIKGKCVSSSSQEVIQSLVSYNNVNNTEIIQDSTQMPILQNSQSISQYYPSSGGSSCPSVQIPGNNCMGSSCGNSYESSQGRNSFDQDDKYESNHNYGVQNANNGDSSQNQYNYGQYDNGNYGQNGNYNSNNGQSSQSYGEYQNGEDTYGGYDQNSYPSYTSEPEECLPPGTIGQDGRCYCPSETEVYFQGVCHECPYPGIFDYSNGRCEYFCGQNAEYLECRQECVCKEGFGVGNDGKCEVCEGSSYLLNGYCVSCPDGKVYDSDLEKCVCPKGTLMNMDCECVERCGEFEIFNETTDSCVCRPGFGREDGKCHLCGQDEAVNDKGICDECDENEVLVGGKCVCSGRYVMNDGECESCSSVNDAFLTKKGKRCAKCPIGSIQKSGRCFIQKGQNPLQGLPSLTPVIVVNPSTTGSDMDQVTPAININGDVQTICGNGLVEGLEQCDDRNSADGDGCSSKCKIEPGFRCSRMPSQCVRIDGTPVAPPTPPNVGISAPPTTPTVTVGGVNPSVNQNLALEGPIRGNSNQVFATLKTSQVFKFKNQNEMRNFIKTAFEGCSAPTVYCGQLPAPKDNLFDCLFLFPSGIPNKLFKVNFSYDYQGQKGATTVDVNPFDIQSTSRRRRNSRRRPRNTVS